MNTTKKVFTLSDLQAGTSFRRLWVEDADLIEEPLYCHIHNLMQTATGYGSKLATSKMIYFEGRKRRVYCSQWSNAGTTYILYKKETIIIN